MAVRVGHLQDPEELPGLAHFLVITLMSLLSLGFV